MKFWLTLILSTISLSVLITWLMIRRDAPRPLPPYPPLQKGEPGELAVADPYKLEVDVIQVQVEKCVIGQTSTVEIPFTNKGKGELRFGLVNKGCGCVSGVQVDEVPLVSAADARGQQPEFVVKKPNETGKLTISWRPTRAQYEDGKGRLLIKVQISVTDRRIGLLIVEIDTRIEQPREGNE